MGSTKRRYLTSFNVLNKLKIFKYQKSEANNPLITRHNNFDLLRLLLACAVLLVHVATLTGSGELKFLKELLSAKVAVDGFFVISGFLIFRSFENTASLNEYFGKRLRRIYPAYFFIIVLCVLIGCVITSSTLNAYLSIETLKYLVYNLGFLNFLQDSLPGVFDSNKFNAVNGALWTIKIEVAFYLCVPLIVALMRRFNLLMVLIVIYTLSTIYFYAFNFYAEQYQYPFFSQLARQLPGQLRFFVSGAILYYFLPFFDQKKKLILLLSVAAFILGNYLTAFGALYPFAVAVIILYLALFVPQLIDLSKIGDLSFGIYIFHFPIIQIIIYFKLFKPQPLVLTFATIVITTFAAMVSWNLIEKPFLKKKVQGKHA